MRRLRPAGIRLFEAWDLPLTGGRFWELAGTTAVARLRARRLGEREVGARQAEAVAEALTRLRERAPFDRAFVGGGLSALPAFAETLRTAAGGLEVHVSDAGPWVAEEGGRALLVQAGAPAGLVADVGQTALKASAGGIRLLRERDLGRLPLRLIGPDGRSGGADTGTAASFLAGALAEALARGRPRDPCLLLALPCAVSDDGVPGACTYGWQDDRSLLPALLERLDAAGRPWPGAEPELLLLNDAELAAETARVVLPAREGASTLCLTLGFGPGGALLASPSPESPGGAPGPAC